MTTNVFDKEAAMLATDSRWSYQLSHAVIYVDDTRFEKLALDQRLAYMFAGNSQKIREWKAWITNPHKLVINRPKVEGNGLAICIIDVEKGDVVFDRNQEIANPDSRFAGTGAWPAHACWSKNKDPLKAVETAKLADRFSGGEVKYLNLKSRESNLLAPDEFESIRQDMLTRGMVMYFQNPPHVPLKDAAANDMEVKNALDKIANGEVSLTAPSPSAENDWTDEERAKLDDVLSRYYPAS